MNAKVESFTRGFFWFGYAVFLSASIPHIAAYFRHFDPATGNQFEDIGYWVIAVLLAVVIDVSDVLVSIAVMKAQASGAKWRDTFGYWFFIIFIMLLSWFLNYQYNVVFGTTEFHAADQQVILGSSVTIGQVNPIVGSAFQLLLLVYTGMAHKFTQKPKILSLEELAKEAEEAKQRAEYQAQIDSVNNAQRAQKRSAFFSSLKDLKQGVTQVITGSDEGDFSDISVANEEELGGSIEDVSNDQSDAIEESMEASKVIPIGASKGARNGSTKPVFVTIEQAASMLQYDTQYVKTLRTQGALKTSGKNKNLITIASVNAVLNSKHGKRKARGKDGLVPLVESVQSGACSEQSTDAMGVLNINDEDIEHLQQSADTSKHRDGKEAVNLTDYPELLV